MWGFSAIGELIQRICSASRGERRLIEIECAPHLQRDTHTTQASVSLTYRWVFEHPLVQNQSSNNKLYWLFWFVVTNSLCSLVSGNACCKGFHSLDFTRVCDSVWLCVHNASQSTCTHRFAINNVYLRHVDWTKVTAEEGIRKQRNLLGGKGKKTPSIYSSCSAFASIKMYFVFYQKVGGGLRWTCPLFCPPPFSVRKASGCQMAKPAGSLFECQNGGRGKVSRKLVIKIPTILLTASPQPAFISPSRIGGKGQQGSRA